MALLDDLKQAATPPTPAGFKPGVVFQGSTPVEVTTPPLPAMTEAGEFAQAVKDLGYPIPDGYTLELVEMQLVQHENFWTREATGDDAVTKAIEHLPLPLPGRGGYYLRPRGSR